MTEAAGVPRRVWSSTALLVLGRVFGSACTFVILWVLARHALSESDFGRFTFYLALFAVLDTLSDLGTGHVAVQRTANDPAALPAILSATRRVRVGAGLLGTLLVGGGALIAGESGAVLVLIASLYPITNALELAVTVFRNRLAWGFPVAVRAASSGAGLGAVLLLHSRGVEQPAAYLVAIASMSALANLALHLGARRFVPPHTTFVAPTREVLRAAIPLGLAGLCQQTYFYVDNLFVRALVGEVELGHYNVATRILSWSIMVAVYTTLTALPWFTREHARGELSSAVSRLGVPLFACAGFGVGLVWPWAGELLSIFGPEFADARASLQWLLLATLVIHAGALRMTALIAVGATRATARVAIAGLAVNLIGNTLLVPRYGIDGAAIATLLTEVTVAVGAGIELSRRGVPPLGPRPWLWVAGGVTMLAGYGVSMLVHSAWS